jgi:hypothetical protein
MPGYPTAACAAPGYPAASVRRAPAVPTAPAASTASAPAAPLQSQRRRNRCTYSPLLCKSRLYTSAQPVTSSRLRTPHAALHSAPLHLCICTPCAPCALCTLCTLSTRLHFCSPLHPCASAPLHPCTPAPLHPCACTPLQGYLSAIAVPGVCAGAATATAASMVTVQGRAVGATTAGDSGQPVGAAC